MTEIRFPSPFDMATPPGAEGWEEMYSYSMLFGAETRREYEDQMFWFRDAIHLPSVMPPWDVSLVMWAFGSLGAYNSRHYIVPPAQGIDVRILNGWMYCTPVPVWDPEDIPARVPHFMERAGFYFGNWNDLYAKWMDKARDVISRLEGISFEPLPVMVPLETVTSGRGLSNIYDLSKSYHDLLDIALELWQYHFEFLNLGYAAYLDYFTFCKQVFPNIPDLSIAKMVAGIDVDLFRPDQELRKLAKSAVAKGLGPVLAQGNPAEATAAVASAPGGTEWLAEFESAQYPWFNYSNGSGFYHTDKVWAEHLEIPFSFLRGYIAKVERGEEIDTPTEEIIAERDRVTEEYLDLLDGDDKEAFQGKLGLSRTVFHYVENHNFYVEHWGHSVMWRKMRELSAVLVKEGFWNDVDDIFMLKKDEVPTAIDDASFAWGAGVKAAGPGHWPAIIAKRRAQLEILQAWDAPPALGMPPEVVSEPFTIMLWGITSDSIQKWLGGISDDGGLSGFAASPGVAEGIARVLTNADQVADIQDGEILVAPLTAPSWAPIFRRIAGTVTDSGGMMSHAAIVCREYGLPAVTGTAFATKAIKTGQRIRVDGNNGTVTILD
jgi:pyruvate, water dikinase